LTVAPAEHPGASLGPVIDAESQARIRKAIETGQREARLAHQTDLGELAEQGYFVGPTIFADVPETATIAQEEIFGPVLSVIRAKDLDDALRIANGVKYALTGGGDSPRPRQFGEGEGSLPGGNPFLQRQADEA